MIGVVGCADVMLIEGPMHGATTGASLLVVIEALSLGIMTFVIFGFFSVVFLSCICGALDVLYLWLVKKRWAPFPNTPKLGVLIFYGVVRLLCLVAVGLLYGNWPYPRIMMYMTWPAMLVSAILCAVLDSRLAMKVVAGKREIEDGVERLELSKGVGYMILVCFLFTLTVTGSIYLLD